MKLTVNGMVFEGTPEELSKLAELGVTPTEEVKYREVKRKAKVGERIKIVAPFMTKGHYKKGDVLIVTGIYSERSVNASGVPIVIRNEEYVVLEPITEEETTVVPAEETSRLKVGEYAKVVKEEYATMTGFNVDDIVKIVRNPYGEDDEDYKVKRLDGYEGYALKTGNYLIRATDEEVEQAKRKLAEAEESAKWATIGREVGEFKVGDVVRVLDRGSSNLSVGDIGIIGQLDGNAVRVNTRQHKAANWLVNHRVELITPVESVVNLKTAE